MATTQDYFAQSQLAFASYAVLAARTPSVATLSDERAGMSNAQARTFAENWAVIEQFSDSTGVLATIFQQVINGIASGPKYVAIRPPYYESGSGGTYYLNIADITGGPSANTVDQRSSGPAMVDALGGNDLIDNQGAGFNNTSPFVSIDLYLKNVRGADEGTGSIRWALS